MQEIPAKKAVDIINSTLNYVDARLMDHGSRVGNYVYSVLCHSGELPPVGVRDVCLTALLHDIGAYKTEEIDQMALFETENIWPHSIYGYLFLKHLSPLAHLAPALFFHHADLTALGHIHPSYHRLAQLIFIADRVDIMAQLDGGLSLENFRRHFRTTRGKYRPDMIDMVEAALFNGGGRPTPERDFREIFDTTTFTEAEMNAYLTMVVLSIDFRSAQTVTHTVTAACISRLLAEILGVGEPDLGRILLGTMLHDLGKQGVPPEILNAPGRLGPEDMAVMRSHVTLTGDILVGNVDEDVFRIAVRHHERLDGSGYPLGLAGDELTRNERLVAVSDIMSALMGVRSYKDAYPKDKVTGIMAETRRLGQLDPVIVEAALDNYDHIRREADREGASVLTLYNTMNREYARFLDATYDFDGTSAPVLDDVLDW